MEKNNMKNIVILNNLPSNIVEEAIVILKPSVKIKNLEKIEQQSKKEVATDIKEKNYVLKEAELLINNYINKIENEKKPQSMIKNSQYKKIKKYTFLFGIISALEFICLLIH